MGSCPRSSPSDVGEDPSAEESITARRGLHCHFLPYFTIYVVGLKKKKKMNTKKLKKLHNGYRMSCCIYLAMQANDSPKIFDDRKLLCFSFFFTFLPENIKHSNSETWLMADILKLYGYKKRVRQLTVLWMLIIVQKSVMKKKLCPPLKAYYLAANSIFRITEKSPAQIIFLDVDYKLNLLSWFFIFFIFLNKELSVNG